MIKGDIKRWIMVLAVVPLVLVSIALSWVLTSAQIRQLTTAFAAQGASHAKQTALASEYGVLAYNLDALRPLVTAAATEHDVLAVSVLGANAEVLVFAGAPHVDRYRELIRHGRVMVAGGVSYHLEPIRSASRLAQDVYIDELAASAPVSPGPSVVGWVVVEQGTAPLQARKAQVMTEAVTITAAFIVVTALCAMWLGRRIAAPLILLTQAVQRVAEGHLDTRLTLGASGEIGSLERGINTMASALEIAHKDLQKQVDDATAELNSALHRVARKAEDLQAANQQAQAASAAKSRFLASMSHELRTPITSIIGFSQLLLKHALPDEQRSHVEFMETSARQLLGIINDVLDFSGIEAGKVALREAPFVLQDCIDDVLQLLAGAANDKDLVLAALVYDDVPACLVADVFRLKQVLTNLVGNAIKFTERGSVEVRCMVVDETEQGIMLGFSVADTGIGIAADALPQLFQPFSQADASSSRLHGGTGLGLMISKELVELMGGTLEVESTEGKGSTFDFTLRCARAADEAEPVGRDALRGCRFAVFDHHPFARVALAHTLRQYGAQSVACATVAELEAALRGLAPDEIYVLTAFTQRDLADGLSDAVLTVAGSYRVVALLNSNDADLRGTVIARGALGCLTRPLRVAGLEASLRRLTKPVAAEVVSTAGGPALAGGCRVLVAEDTPIVRALIQRQLAYQGLDCELVVDGAQAIAAAQRERFDLILLDLHMPAVDGTMAAQAIRETGMNRATPIVALTADIVLPQVEDLARYGINETVIKPLDDARLEQLLATWMGRTGVLSNPSPERPATSAHPAPAIDPGFLLAQARGNPVIVDQTLGLLREDLIEKRALIATSHAATDWAALREQVHKVHGAARYCGAPALKRSAQELELALDDARHDGLNELVARLDTSLLAVIREVEQRLRPGDSAPTGGWTGRTEA